MAAGDPQSLTRPSRHDETRDVTDDPIGFRALQIVVPPDVGRFASARGLLDNPPPTYVGCRVSTPVR